MKILILKNRSNDFEEYFSERMVEDNVDVSVTLKSVNSYMAKLRRYVGKTGWASAYYYWLGSWKHDIKKYNRIIVFDYDLSLTLIKWIRKTNRTATVIIWLWNIPGYDISPYKKYAKICCFDKEYCKENKINYVPQFYFRQEVVCNNTKNKIFYIGTDKSRFRVLKGFVNDHINSDIEMELFLVKNQNTDYTGCPKQIRLIDIPLKYSDVLKKINESTCILEYNPVNQKGLTIRALEALFFGKKLITNNKTILEYGFYNPANIYILGCDNRTVENFLEEKYIRIDERKMQEFSYNNWINSMRNI